MGPLPAVAAFGLEGAAGTLSLVVVASEGRIATFRPVERDGVVVWECTTPVKVTECC